MRLFCVLILASAVACTGGRGEAARPPFPAPMQPSRAIAQYLDLRSVVIDDAPDLSLCSPLDTNSAVKTMLDWRRRHGMVGATRSAQQCSPARIVSTDSAHLEIVAVLPGADSSLVRSARVGTHGEVWSREEYWTRWFAYGSLTIRFARGSASGAVGRTVIEDYLMSRRELTGTLPYVVVCADSVGMPEFDESSRQLLRADVVVGIHRDTHCRIPASAYQDSTLAVLRVSPAQDPLAGRPGITAEHYVGGHGAIREWQEHFTRAPTGEARLVVDAVRLYPRD